MILKKSFAIVVIITLLLSSCIAKELEIPYGVWESNEPDIVMYLDPATEGIPETGWTQTFEAIYAPENGEAMNLSVLFNDNDGRLMLYELIELDDDVVSYNIYYSGTFWTNSDTLTLDIVNQTAAGTDYKKIVFTKTKDYDKEME